MGRGGRGGGGHSSGGHGGGGRSSGGGGRASARSSGGRSGGARRGGYAGRSARGSYSGGRRSAGMPRMGGPHIHSIHYGPRHAGRRAHPYGGAASNAAQVAAVLAITAVFFAAIIAICFAATSSSGITKSTVRREKLPSQYVTETGWYTDVLGWIKSGSKLTSGMRSFYGKTGVQPYLYITDTVNGTTSPTDADMEEYAQALYEELFSDEGHILLLFYERDSNADYKTWYVCGAAAKTVMDKEACDILLDYVDHYYFSDLEDDEMFSLAFEKAGARIMGVTRSPVLVVTIAPLALGILLALVIASVVGGWNPIAARRARKAQEEAKKAEELERVLNADVCSVEDPALKELEEKYKDPK